MPQNLGAEQKMPANSLQVTAGLMERLHAENIVYCHWKSNEHLREALLGITDMDFLVDRAAAAGLARVLDETGYKRFAAVSGRSYPGVEDYLAMDDGTGRLAHLHLHYRLTLGQKHLKGYRLPWEDTVLAGRRFDEAGQTYVSDPHAELLLLIVRSVLKIRARDRCLAVVGRAYVRGAEMREFRWLRERVEPARLRELAVRLVGEEAATVLVDIADRGPGLRRLLKFRAAAAERLNLCRTYGPVEATLRRWARELLWLRSGLGKRLLPPVKPLSRTDPRGGLIIAFVGPDGSGKSTLVRGIVRWLSWKIDARGVYFGSGDGPSSLLRWPLKLALRVARRAGLVRPPGIGTCSEATRAAGHSPPRPAGPIAWARVLWALVLAREKSRSLRRAWRGRNLGMVMVCDRYPQSQVMGFNDGPLLAHWREHRWRPLRALSRLESAPYRFAEEHPPDLVIKLRVSPGVARARKPEMRLEEIVRRNEAIASLKFPSPTIVCGVEADRSLDEVMLQAKRHVWAAL